MEDRYTLVFDDETDDFGNQKEFTIKDYTFDFETDTNDLSTTGATSDTSILELEMYNTTNLSIVEWSMANLASEGVLKNGNFTIYSHSDGAIERDIRFENAECIKLTQGGYQKDDLEELEKTLVFKFIAKAVAIDGVTVLGTLRAERTQGKQENEETESKIQIKSKLG